MTTLFRPLIAAALALAATAASAQVRITEWMYGGAGPEYIEFTNLGSSAINFAGWSFDDDSRLPGSTSLSNFGLVAAGESVIL
ncbi:MAG TPA: lamin tail domain-containing protein, partial [Burkholderiaceae bacterium]